MNPRADAAAYALGLVAEGDREAFERRMQQEPVVARDVADFTQVAALLALAAPPAQPPVDLRRRILGRASGGR